MFYQTTEEKLIKTSLLREVFAKFKLPFKQIHIYRSLLTSFV